MESIILENATKIFTLKKSDSHQNHDLKQSVNIQKNKLVALNNISFSVSEGEMIGIIGLNGSGKTTLLRLISGIYPPTSGKVQVYGRLAPLLQLGAGFHSELIAKDNIIMYGMLLGLSKSEILSRVDKIIDFAELREFSNMKLKNYSAGMSVRLAFSTAMEIDPDILLIDEVLAVGDIGFAEKSYKAFLSFKEREKTIVFTSHNLQTISELSDRVLLLNKGKMEYFGNPEEAVNMYKDIIT